MLYIRLSILLILSVQMMKVYPRQCGNEDEEISRIFGDRKEVYFRFNVFSEKDIHFLTRIISIDRVSGGHVVYAYANPLEFGEFLDYGAEYALLVPPGLMVQPEMRPSVNLRALTEWDFYPTYEAYLDMMNQFAQDYPDLCEVFSIGQSIQGREFTLEISEDKMPLASQLPNFWEYNYRSFLNYIEQTGFGIRGAVTDSVTGQPLIAEVYIEDHEKDSSWIYSTAATGIYFRPVYAGIWDVTFSAPGFFSKNISWHPDDQQDGYFA